MVLHGESMYARLHKLAIVRYGYSARSLMHTIKDVLVQVWCKETVRPDFAQLWHPSNASLGQSDVTSYYLAKEVFGSEIVGVNLRGRDDVPYFAVWSHDRVTTSIYDFCTIWVRRAPSVSSFWSPDDFLEMLRTQLDGEVDYEIDRRVAVFSERFETAMSALEHPTQERDL